MRGAGGLAGLLLPVLLPVLLPAVLVGCADFPGSPAAPERAPSGAPASSPFTQALAHEYQAFALSEQRRDDWVAAQHFAGKGAAAADGNPVPPEALEDWTFDDQIAAAALSVGRSRLMAVLATSAPRHAPALTATAQVKFDCWVQQQAQARQPGAPAHPSDAHLVACRKDFLAAVDMLEAQLRPGSGAIAAAGEARPARPLQVLVFFDEGEDRVPAEAARSVAEAARAAKAAGYPRLQIIGHTDATGPAGVNQELSRRRAEAVKRALVAAGVPAGRLVTEGRGKADPLVPTPDGVREPQNRRVTIRFPG